jgi:signal transduction histidine kinase
VVVKLAAVLLVPTVVALVAGVLRIVDQAGAAPGYARITQIVRVQQQLSDLITAIAHERDLSTAFVAQGRMGDRRSLDTQFRAVDNGVRTVAEAANQVRGLDFARSPLAALGALGPLRASVTTGFGPVEVVVTEYSDAIDPLVELDSTLTRQLDDVAVTNEAAAVHALVAAQEQISHQHAIVSAALYTNRLGPGQIDELRTATVRLATDQDAVRGALPPAERAKVINGIGQDAELARQRMLQLVLNRGIAGEPLNTAPQEWDQRTAVVIGNYVNVEKGLRQQVGQTAQALLDKVRTTAGLNSVVLFFALGLGVLVGILVTRALLRPLGVLKRTALDVADRRLPEAMARIREGDLPEAAIEPVPVGTREEIGQVARAFDEVHSQAVRLASEQAQLRSNVNDIFVNLSRRTQGLVERQLKLIDRLESGEQDPKQLDNLFQLDHLATRMRRNSENLLVLAGTDAASRSGRPVRLVDVLRAAVSEVEQYQRLVLQQPPAVLVLGRAASDLVHLLAELLDNATQFSPPESHVRVSSDFSPDGSITIEVADRGVGMNERELAEANARLARPPVVDGSVSRRMGLFVVGRLAGRHGILVQLRCGDGGTGVWASVIMPPRLVRVASESVEPRVVGGAEPVGTEGGVPDPRSTTGPQLDHGSDRGVGARTGTGASTDAVPAVDVVDVVDAAGSDVHGDPGTDTDAEVGSGDTEDSAGIGDDNAGTGEDSAGTGDDSADTGDDNADTGDDNADTGDIAAEVPDDLNGDADSDAELTAEIDVVAEGPQGSVPDNVQNSARDNGLAVAAQAGADPVYGHHADSHPSNGDDPQRGDQPGEGDLPRRDSGLAKRISKRPAPGDPPPAPPGPPASPQEAGPEPEIPSGGSGKDLFRPTRSAAAGPGPRVTLQHSTPIFDDVASAWFKEHEAVPVRWTAPSVRGPAGAMGDAPTRQAPTRDAPLPDAPLPDAPAADDTPTQAMATVQPAAPLPLTRRQPGRTLAEAGTATVGAAPAVSQPTPAQPAPAPDPEAAEPAGAQSADWGGADEGWRAAEALARPVDAEITAMGLPRRQPRALLVPGAVSSGEPANVPVRSAESIRGRLSSYQQGIREGRLTRRSIQQEPEGADPSVAQPAQHDGEEAAK